MEEKFAANPVTGTGSLTVPLTTSPGRSGFGPQLSLSYDSAAGNGPFGFGWTLSTPSITRKTDKGLPQYRDAEESDEYVLSGTEDLVPALLPNGARFEDDVSAPGYRIHRYVPRIEGLFARIERWTNRATSEVHWRSITRDNVTTLYGRTANSRIADPDAAGRIFRWWISASYDDKGNAIVYEYVEENDDGVDRSRVHERNRTTLSRSAQRYLKRIKYGNRIANRSDLWEVTDPSLVDDWMFEVVFDYGEGHYTDLPLDNSRPEADQHAYVLAQAGAAAPWPARQDPFSSYRSGFEVRTYRLCRRMLLFHHFPDELGIADYLVGAAHFTYAESPFASFITAITQSGYRRDPAPAQPNRYLKKSLPPLEFEYSQADIDETVKEVDASSLENLPFGLDGGHYQWVDLDGEGVSGILAEQATGWFYKRNLSPANRVADGGSLRAAVRLAPAELVPLEPAAGLRAAGTQLLDLAGDGQLDLVQLDPAVCGFYERTPDAGWSAFRPFSQFPNVDFQDPNLRFIDLDGDGRTDLLISSDEVFDWHPSLGERGFGPAASARKPQDDEERGPRLVFADAAQSIYLADLSGDGLTDLVRIRNGEVCYWPNVGYGRFGAKVTMDRPPLFDATDEFDQRRVRLGDIDGSGTSDIFYLGRHGVTIWRNESGNGWGAPRTLGALPPADNISSFAVVDLLGTGTACLVWSSPLPAHRDRRMRYVDLMSRGKPYLLVRVANNLGAETRVQYSPSTTFYVADRLAGRPWITRLPFPVHVVERVETYDHVSRNRFTSRYAYHHGYFDGEEREFRGFGMVEQFDTEELAVLTAGGDYPAGDNIDPVSHVPPVLTKTWYHTGVFAGRDRVSSFFAGLLDGRDAGEYYREPGLTDQQARALLLDDTVLPDALPAEEEREACRALKGAILRQEIYALDRTPGAMHPYRVSERNYTLKRVQPRGASRHAVFFSHARETVDYYYERNPADPRIAHSLTLEVDGFGNVLKSATIGYGRRHPDASLSPDDRRRQSQTLVTYTESTFTDPIDVHDAYRAPLPCETRSYELTGYTPSGAAARFDATDFVEAVPSGLVHSFDGEIPYEEAPTAGRQRRLIEQVRTYYRPNDLGAAQQDPRAQLPFGQADSLALPSEIYRLAYTPGLLARVYRRGGNEALLPDVAAVLPADAPGGQFTDRGGYVDLDGDGRWWIPSGRMFYSPDAGDTAVLELAFARRRFFLGHRHVDPFGQVSTVVFDRHGLMTIETRDALDNRVTVGERNPDPNLPLLRHGQDYRVLQPALLMDPNRNCSEVAFDAFGLVVGIARMGKPEENPRPGDSLAGFVADLTQRRIDDFFAAPDPRAVGRPLLAAATTRIVYDANRFRRSRRADPLEPARWMPAFGALLSREIHVSELDGDQQSAIQASFTYSDGFGREIQKKIQAEPGPVPRRDPATGRILIRDGRPELTADDVSPRWAGSGWIIHNNKGKPVRQYEPFFTDTHQFDFDVRIGVSPVVFYDPAERAIATLYPNDTYEKVRFGPWQQETWDGNDTVLLDPRTDADVNGFTEQYFAALDAASGGGQTWYAARVGGALGPHEQDAARKTAAHANTPASVYFDTLGRPFLTLVHNGFNPDGTPLRYATRVLLDVEGNEREVVDANDCVVMRYDYEVPGNRIHQSSMEAGERWLLADATGNPIRAWDSRGQGLRTEYDRLRRPLRTYVTGADSANPNQELLTERLVYGEQHPDAEVRNLRGTIYLHADQAGVVTSEARDFKGNLLSTVRRPAREYRQAIGWSSLNAALPADGRAALDPVALEAALVPVVGPEVFADGITYDALNRPILVVMPHTLAMSPSAIRRAYNEANLLNTVQVNVRDERANGVPVWRSFVANIDYDARGRRTSIEYGSGAAANRRGVTTSYVYDPFTFRLAQAITRRNALDFPDDCPQSSPSDSPGCQVQHQLYTYDPAGNITHVLDTAQQAIYFRNRRVEPSADYTYDPMYQLVEAWGREHLGQADGVPIPHAPDEGPRVRVLHPDDGYAIGTYTERYVYDPVGNILEMQHYRRDRASSGWTRTYAYDEPSLLEPARSSNRLSSTAVGANPPERYRHDAHGNMIRMPHLGGAHPDANMHWDYRDRLHQADLGGGGTVYYVYDASGRRVRKVWEKGPGLTEDRLYLGGFEVFRRRNGAGAVTLARETLHVMDDTQRIALVETRTFDAAGDDPAPQQLTRYQVGDHLGSAALELDDRAQIISYEEYYPYGSTSYHAVRRQTDTPKRFRHAAKERDEESGLYHCGARYHAPWLGRWTSADPRSLIDGPNLYRVSRNSPVRYRDASGTAPTEVENLNIGAERVVRNMEDSYLHYVDSENLEGEELVREIRETIESSSNVTLNIAPYTAEEGPLYITEAHLTEYFPILEEIYEQSWTPQGTLDTRALDQGIADFVAGGEGRFTAWEVFHAVQIGVNVDVHVVLDDVLGNPINDDIEDVRAGLEGHIRAAGFVAQPVQPVIPGTVNNGPIGPLSLPNVPARIPDNRVNPHIPSELPDNSLHPNIPEEVPSILELPNIPTSGVNELDPIIREHVFFTPLPTYLPVVTTGPVTTPIPAGGQTTVGGPQVVGPVLVTSVVAVLIICAVSGRCNASPGPSAYEDPHRLY